MAKKKEDLSEEFKKINQFFVSRYDREKYVLGIQLLKATMNADLIVQLIDHRYHLCYPLVAFFQKQPSLWAEVEQKLPSHRKSDIKRFMKHRILDLEGHSLEDFCALANQVMVEYLPDFPELHPSILTEHNGYYVGSTRSGEAIKYGIGWSFTVDIRDIGPAETIHEEDWEAVAHHPTMKIKIYKEDRGEPYEKVWLVKINKKPSEK